MNKKINSFKSGSNYDIFSIANRSHFAEQLFSFLVYVTTFTAQKVRMTVRKDRKYLQEIESYSTQRNTTPDLLFFDAVILVYFFTS